MPDDLGRRKPATRREPNSAQRRRTWAICQLEITLDDIEPRIWRRIQIPYPCTFWDLHVAIQDAMGWKDMHLHEFVVGSARRNPKVSIGLPDPDLPPHSPDVLPDWEVTIHTYLTPESPEATYIYDFGDEWRHTVRLEHVASADPGLTYPRCIAGERACPPEDVGGPPGYERLLEALHDPNPDPGARELLDWLGEGFDPERFDPQSVRFTNADTRLRRLLRDQ